MARLYSAIPKFKRIEACLRETNNEHQRLINQINETIRDYRSVAKIQLLTEFRDQCATIHRRSRGLLRQLYDAMENPLPDQAPCETGARQATNRHSVSASPDESSIEDKPEDRSMTKSAIDIEFRKLKSLAKSLQTIVDGYSAVVREIGLAIAGPRTPAEIDLLASIRRDCSSLRAASQSVLRRLFDAG